MGRRLGNKGFTLLELVIVVIVIAILIAIALPRFLAMVERGRIARAQSYCDMVRKAEAVIYASTDAYTADASALTAEVAELNDIKFSGNPGAGADAYWAYRVVLDPTLGYAFIATRSYNGTAYDIAVCKDGWASDKDYGGAVITNPKHPLFIVK